MLGFHAAAGLSPVAWGAILVLFQVLLVIVQKRGEARQHAVTQQESEYGEAGGLEQSCMFSNFHCRSRSKVKVSPRARMETRRT